MMRNINKYYNNGRIFVKRTRGVQDVSPAQLPRRPHCWAELLRLLRRDLPPVPAEGGQAAPQGTRGRSPRGQRAQGGRVHLGSLEVRVEEDAGRRVRQADVHQGRVVHV